MKKIFVILLSFMLLTQNISTAVFASQTEEITNPKAEFMKEIGVMTALPSNYDAYVSRAEFALYAARVINVSEYGEADKRLFIDVPMDHWAVYAINGLVDKGVISSHPEGKFRPDDGILVDEAVKMLVCALGYKPYAEANGGYPVGYIRTANQIGLNLDVKSGERITYADTVDMLYDALNTEILEGIEYSDEGIKYTHSEDVTPLSVYRNIYCAEGKVTAADGISINSDYNADFGEIAVENEVFKYEGEPFTYLGKYVSLFYEKTGNEQGKAIFVIADETENKVVEFEKEDFLDFDASANRVTYFVGDDEKSIKTESGLNVIKNGDVIGTDTENTIKNVTKGKYTFIDSDDNGGFETLVISEYKNAVVSYVDTKNNKIYDKYAPGVPMDVSNDAIKKTIIYKDSQQINLENIAIEDVLTVYESKNYARIYVSTSSVTGQVSSIVKDSSSTKICIGGNWYGVDEDVAVKQGISVRVGMEGKFITDIFGKIAYISAGASGLNYTMGYIVDYASEGLFEDKVLLKMYVPTVGLKEYNLSNKVKIDGTTAQSETEIITLLSKYSGAVSGQIIFFKETDGLINIIDTPNFDAKNEDENTIKPNVSETGVKYRQNKFGKTIISNDSTVIIGVPEDEALKNSKEYDFSALAVSSISISKEFNVNSYKFDLESGFDDVIVIKNYISGSPSNELVVVDEIATAQKNDEVVECLTYYKGGYSSELYVDSSKSLIADKIKQGDVLRIGTDAKGDIINWEIVFSYKADAVPSDVNEVNYGSLFNTTDRVIFGYVKSVNDGVLKLYRDKNKPDVIDEVFNISEADMTIYDSSASKKEFRLSSGNYNQITAYDVVGVPSMAIIRTNLAQIKDVIIFK